MAKEKQITKSEEKRLKKHKPHHTAKHLRHMRRLMSDGLSFSRAHSNAMKKVGK